MAPSEYDGKYPNAPPDQWTSCSTPSLSDPGTIPRYSSIRAFHTVGRSSTETLPEKRSRSISNRRITCSGYVTSSASTRMREGSTMFTAWYMSCAVQLLVCGKYLWTMGVAHSQKASDCPTIRSQRSDWLSCTAMPSASLTGRSMCSFDRPCSYMAWPHSWIVPATPSIQFSSEYRVVMRTSVGWEPPVNGCTETSIRPSLKSNPIAPAISLHMAACCTGSQSGPPRRGAATSWRDGSAATLAAMFLMRGAKSSLTALNISTSRGSFILGSNASMAASYRSMSGLVVR
mmetsp:Transcript_51314/g.121602  ORF Transcript_51314/g.121602 Transcript_51314/m.121602 type:complete len:288 (+) Transcript_51314:276-1139(+)